MSSQNYALQISLKTPAGTLINIPAGDATEAREGLSQVRSLAQDIITTERILAGVGAAAPLVVADPAPAPALSLVGGNAPPPAFTPPAPAASSPGCPHGPMVWRTGESARGPWGGWFCPLPKERKNEQCAPQWDKSFGK